MTMLAKMRMSFLVNIMSIHQRKELNVVEGSACNCSYPTWKLASHIMEKCHKLHHGFQCVCCHEHNVRGAYP
jgi:hypothetical protein